MRNWNRFSIACLLLVGIGGCGKNSNRYFPVQKGADWTYSYRTLFTSGVCNVSALEPTSVANAPGWVLSGPQGRSRVAWSNGVLYAAELAGTRYEPSIPILKVAKSDSKYDWEGEIYTGVQGYKASAQITQTPANIVVVGRNVSGIRVRTLLEFGNHRIETVSIFAPGQGLVLHERRENDKFISALEYLSGP